MQRKHRSPSRVDDKWVKCFSKTRGSTTQEETTSVHVNKMLNDKVDNFMLLPVCNSALSDTDERFYGFEVFLISIVSHFKSYSIAFDSIP